MYAKYPVFIISFPTADRAAPTGASINLWGTPSAGLTGTCVVSGLDIVTRGVRFMLTTVKAPVFGKMESGRQNL